MVILSHVLGDEQKDLLPFQKGNREKVFGWEALTGAAFKKFISVSARNESLTKMNFLMSNFIKIAPPAPGKIEECCQRQCCDVDFSKWLHRVVLGGWVIYGRRLLAPPPKKCPKQPFTKIDSTTVLKLKVW